MRSFMRATVLVLLLARQTCCGESPRFFRENAFTSASFAEAVNHFVRLGEKAAVEELKGLADGINLTNGFSVKVRIGLVCRVLFQPPHGAPIRPPAYGFLMELGSIGLPPGLPSSSWTRISQNWPLYPVARSGSTYFVLSESYSFEGTGGPEDPMAYVSYCRTHGVFRKKIIPVPTRKEATKDAVALRLSAAWGAIKWTDSGVGYSFHINEDAAWNYIQNQAKTMPDG
jgi:hypothetical protein